VVQQLSLAEDCALPAAKNDILLVLPGGSTCRQRSLSEGCAAFAPSAGTDQKLSLDSQLTAFLPVGPLNCSRRMSVANVRRKLREKLRAEALSSPISPPAPARYFLSERFSGALV